MAVVDIAEQTFVYLLGKAGTGKSSTGNTILGSKYFKASSSSTAATKDIRIGKTNIGNWTVSVVDGPGLVGGSDAGFDHQAMLKFKQVYDTHPSCGHIILIVCRYGERFTAEDSEIVTAVRRVFGHDVFKDRGIVVVTCGNNFEADYEGEDTTFESWCKMQGGDFGKLVASCGQRVLLIENASGAEQGGQFLSRLHKFMSAVNFGFCRSSSLMDLVVHTLKNPSMDNAMTLSTESAKRLWGFLGYILTTAGCWLCKLLKCCFCFFHGALECCWGLLFDPVNQVKAFLEPKIYRS